MRQEDFNEIRDKIPSPEAEIEYQERLKNQEIRPLPIPSITHDGITHPVGEVKNEQIDESSTPSPQSTALVGNNIETMKTAVIYSREEAMALPLKERPLNYRLSSSMYHDTFQAIGEASMCWKPRPSGEVFASEEASDVAVRLCFKIAEEIEGKTKSLEAERDRYKKALEEISRVWPEGRRPLQRHLTQIRMKAFEALKP